MSDTKRVPYQKLTPGEPIVILNFLVVLRDGETHVEQHVSLRFPEEEGKKKDPMGGPVHEEAFELAARRYRKERSLPSTHVVHSESVQFERGRLDKAK